MTHKEAFDHYISNQYNVSIAQVMAMCSNSNESESFWRLAMEYRRNLPSGVRLV